jgi:hypothetical protein
MSSSAVTDDNDAVKTNDKTWIHIHCMFKIKNNREEFSNKQKDEKIYSM